MQIFAQFDSIRRDQCRRIDYSRRKRSNEISVRHIGWTQIGQVNHRWSQTWVKCNIFTTRNHSLSRIDPNGIVSVAKSFGKTAKIDRWLNNAGEIHSDCILNEGNVLRAKSASDSGSVKSTCSEEDVLNYFKTRQRNAGKLQSKTNGALISEKSKQPVHSEEGAKPKKAVAPSAVAYTSLAKGKNDVAQRPGLNAPAVVSHPWTNGETSTREVCQTIEIVQSRDLSRAMYEAPCCNCLQHVIWLCISGVWHSVSST